MATDTLVSCPKCGHQFRIEDAVARQLQEKMQAEFDKRASAMQMDYEKKEQQLRKKAEEIDKQVELKLKAERERLSLRAKADAQLEYEQRIKALSEENETRRKQLQDLQRTQIENEQLKRKVADQRSELELEFEKRMTERLNEEAEKIRKRETENMELKLKEKDTQLDALKGQIDEMKRKAEQGSMQLQGEVQELALEEILKSLFPFDEVREVGKGVRGADTIQVVKNHLGMDCGRIAYESKRTKKFAEDWIEKLKADALLEKADICVIVTQAMPEGMEKIGQLDGVWICQYHDVKGLAMVLRDGLIRVHGAVASQANKGEKMQMLYDYLTGNEFRLQLEAIVDGFKSLKDGYEDEKLKMQKIWKEREKQLEKVLLNTAGMYGSIRGIAGSSVPEIKMLEGGAEQSGT
jgi:hypothetical protein